MGRDLLTNNPLLTSAHDMSANAEEGRTHRLVHLVVNRRHAVLVLLGDAVGVARPILGREVRAADLLLVNRPLVGALNLSPLSSAVP